MLSDEVLIKGILFRARYLGSTQLAYEGQPTKSTRMMQAEEAVSRIKVNLIKLFQIIFSKLTSIINIAITFTLLYHPLFCFSC